MGNHCGVYRGHMRGAGSLHLALYTHPLGWDLRLEGQHAFPRSRICRTREDVAAAAEEWRKMLEVDGWKFDGS